MRIAKGDEVVIGTVPKGQSLGEGTVPDAPPLARVPYAFARRHGLLPTGEEDGKLDVAMREGADPKALIAVSYTHLTLPTKRIV